MKNFYMELSSRYGISKDEHVHTVMDIAEIIHLLKFHKICMKTL
jgi:hypothetical protein